MASRGRKIHKAIMESPRKASMKDSITQLIWRLKFSNPKGCKKSPKEAVQASELEIPFL